MRKYIETIRDFAFMFTDPAPDFDVPNADPCDRDWTRARRNGL